MGEQWTLLIVRDLAMGLTRFDDIQRSLGVSRKLLAQRLNWLCEEGFVKKTPVRPGVRRRQYTPTEKCSDLLPVLMAMAEWGEKWTPNTDGKRIIPIEARSNSPVHIAFCRETDQRRVPLKGLTFKAGPGADPEVKRYIGEFSTE